MNAKEQYKQAYRMWRIVSRFQLAQMDGKASNYSDALYFEGRDLIEATVGVSISRAAHQSEMNRDLPMLENERTHGVRCHNWLAGKKAEVIENIKLWQPYKFPWKNQPVVSTPKCKRSFINSTRVARFDRRLKALTCWELTELGRAMLRGDDDSDGGDFGPAVTPTPSPFPSGIFVAELGY